MVLSTRNPRPMMELRCVSPQCFLLAPNTQADMQPYHASNQKGTPVRIKTGTSSSSLGIAASRIQPMLVLKQSGEGADYLTHDLDMETDFITTTSTELHTPDIIKMIDIGQMACSVFPRSIVGSAEDSVHQGTLAGTSETAIFDVQLDASLDSGSGLPPFGQTEGASWHPCTSILVDSVLPSETHMQSMPPCVSSMVESGLSSEVLPCDSGVMGSVLPSERPFSPSEFLQKNPAPSSQPEMLDLVTVIDQVLPELPENNTWDSTLDLDLCSQFGESNILDTILQDIGIGDEMKEEINFDMKGDTPQPTVPVPTTSSQPAKIKDNVGPVRTRRARTTKKPARYRGMQSFEDEPTTSQVPVMAELEDVMASTSGTTPTRRKMEEEELSNEEKYLRSRQQNNLASKRCREKRKANVERMANELQELERRNKELHDKVAQLTVLRDNFQVFVNKFLFQQITKK